MKVYLLWMIDMQFGDSSLLDVYHSESDAREEQEKLSIHSGGCKRYHVEERKVI